MENIYFDYDKVISYNALLNFLIGSRGVGKTYGITKFVVNQFIKKGHEFFYIRRFKTEIKKSVPKFFDALKETGEFEDHNLSIKGNNFYCDNMICGYSYNLSTFQNLKSSNFPKVRYIIFDEFIIENGNNHYLSNEVELLLGAIETIARDRNINVFLLGNSVSILNPYFLYFNIDIPYNSEIKLYREGTILFQYINNQKFMEYKKETRFGKMVKGTSYEAYAIENKFDDVDNNFIRHKQITSKFAFAISYKSNIFGVWFDYTLGCIFVSRDYDKQGQMFVLTTIEHKENTLLLTSIKDYHSVKTFIKNYKIGNVYFESPKIKTYFKEIIKMMLKK